MFRPKKHLGQNFLKNEAAIRDMIHAAGLTKRDTVLEVGPGMGAITVALAHTAKRVIAIEKDVDLIPTLEEKFRRQKNVTILHGDILAFTGHKLLTKKYKLVANIPYYLTSRFLRVFLSEASQKPTVMVLMVQREIAERVMGGTRLRQSFGEAKESLLSLSVKAYAAPSLVRMVPRGSFVPPPKVDSAIIKIEGISNAWFVKNKIGEKKFFETLRTAFQKKRKMLRHSLGIRDPRYSDKRPEDLSLEDWAAICSSPRI